jgi:hypothetical protein
MTRAIELRILKLEAQSPAPPSDFDHLTLDELRVDLLGAYSEILDRGGLPAIDLQEVRNWHQAIVDDITLTVELRSGARPYPVPLHSYADTVAKAAERWAAAGGKSAYVPSLCHGDTGACEYDGFGRPGRFFPDLMERRTRLWAHPIVESILRVSPRKFLRTRKSSL